MIGRQVECRRKFCFLSHLVSFQMPGMAISNKRAAIFDWDGVIVDSAPQHAASWEYLAEEIGRALPVDHFKKGFGQKNERIIPALGWAQDPAEIQRLSLRKEAIYRELLVRDGVQVLPGVRTFLAELTEAGIPRVVGSSTHRENIETIFRLTGLGDYFSGIISAENVEEGKPSPDVFLKAAGLAVADPQECVVFEDAMVGIEAARRAHMKVVAVATTHPQEELAHSDLVIGSLADMTLARFLQL